MDGPAGAPLDFRYVEANPSFATQSGVGHVVGKTIREAFPGEPEEWFQTYDRVLRTGEPIRFERGLVMQGRVLELYAFRTDHDSHRRVAVIFKDVTDRKEAEEERKHLLVSERSARDDAETANHLKDEFLAPLSHELRTPLNAILGWVQMLRAGTLDGIKTARALASVERNAKAQQQLVADLMDVSGIITGKLRFEPGPIDLAPAIEAAIDVVRPAAEAKGVHLDLVLDSTVGLVSGGAIRMQQIVWSVLANAIKFTPRGAS